MARDTVKQPTDIDRYVGMQVRAARRELKLTQDALGKLLNITFQQVQKYEKGVNRVSAGRLYEIAAVLGVQIAYFYEGASKLLPQRESVIAEDDAAPSAPVLSADTLELIAAFQSITEPSLRKSLLDNMTAMANALNNGSPTTPD